jgi:uncharacterized protein YsxB (DUF464 family)
MIKVIINKKNNDLYKIDIKGHANYDESGKDIICAAVSSTVLTTINAIESINAKVIEYSKHDGEISITILKKDDIIDKLLRNMISMLEELAQNYNKYIKIIEEV